MSEEKQYLDGELLAKMVRGGAARLRSNASEVNNLNVFPVPDGDTGDNMSMTIEGGVAAIEGMQSSNLAEVASKVAQGMLLGARGNSGVILSQLFAGIANSMHGSETERADAVAIGRALQAGVKQAYSAVITPTEGTILTVAREAVDYTVARITPESSLKDLFADLIKECYASLQRTPELLQALKDAGVIDSGGAGLFYIIDGVYKILCGEEIETSDMPVAAAPEQPKLDSFGPDSEMEYGYCTELLLQLQNSKVDTEKFDVATVTDFLKTVGNSIVSFKTGTIIKLHVHTMTPEKVLAFCRQYGEFLTVKIENMSVQHHETLQENGEQAAGAPAKSVKHKKYASVAVASGDGIRKLFGELGVDAVVDGGQTQNPSAQDFLKAFDKVNADYIFVFPNNGNIVMAAKQAAEIYEKADVRVIESKNLGAGYAAISAINYEADDPDAIAEMLTDAMADIETGCVSPAIRDAELNGVVIHSGDYIGFVGKEMLVSTPDKTETTLQLLEKMKLDEKYLATVFCGKDATAAEIEAVKQGLADNYPDVEAYFVDGGQDVYSFIIEAE